MPDTWIFLLSEFTKKIGNLSEYRFAFDYEYILRILQNKGIVVKLDSIVAQFRYYQESKSGSQDAHFFSKLCSEKWTGLRDRSILCG